MEKPKMANVQSAESDREQAMKLGEMLAFPSHGTMGEVVQPGMTLRQYIATAAMRGLLANPEYYDFYNKLEKEGSSREKIAEWKAKRAVLYADALLAALEDK